MTLTDDLLTRAYMKATGRNIAPNMREEARAFIRAVFDELTPTLDGWETECGEPLYRRPE